MVCFAWFVFLFCVYFAYSLLLLRPTVFLIATAVDDLFFSVYDEKNFDLASLDFPPLRFFFFFFVSSEPFRSSPIGHNKESQPAVESLL